MPVLEKPRSVKAIIADQDALAIPRFATAQIGKAGDVPAETIRTWFKRRVISLDDEEIYIGEAPESIGLGRLFSGYTAMIVAIMGKLISGGMTAENAKSAAYKFVMAGDDKRMPCHLFSEGETVLVIPKNAPGGARVLNLSRDGKDESWRELFIGLGSPKQIEILRLDELWQTVFHRLGVRAEVERRAEERAKGKADAA